MGYRLGSASGFAQFEDSFSCPEDEELQSDPYAGSGAFKTNFSPSASSIKLPAASPFGERGSRQITTAGSHLGSERPALQRDLLQSRESRGSLRASSSHTGHTGLAAQQQARLQSAAGSVWAGQPPANDIDQAQHCADIFRTSTSSFRRQASCISRDVATRQRPPSAAELASPPSFSQSSRPPSSLGLWGGTPQKTGNEAFKVPSASSGAGPRGSLPSVMPKHVAQGLALPQLQEEQEDPFHRQALGKSQSDIALPSAVSREDAFRTSVSGFRKQGTAGSPHHPPSAAEGAIDTLGRSQSTALVAAAGDAFRASTAAGLRKQGSPPGLSKRPPSSAAQHSGALERAAVGVQQTSAPQALGKSQSESSIAKPSTALPSGVAQNGRRGSAVMAGAGAKKVGVTGADMQMIVDAKNAASSARKLPSLLDQKSQSSSLPSLDQKNHSSRKPLALETPIPALEKMDKSHSSFGKTFGVARDRLRNIWQFGKTRTAPAEEQTLQAVVTRDPDALPEHLELIAEKVFRKHTRDTPGKDGLSFALLPAALQSLQAECKDFDLSDNCLEQVHHKFGSLSSTDLSFPEFVELFKQGLHLKRGTDEVVTKRGGNTSGLPVIATEEQRPTSVASSAKGWKRGAQEEEARTGSPSAAAHVARGRSKEGTTKPPTTVSNVTKWEGPRPGDPLAGKVAAHFANVNKRPKPKNTRQVIVLLLEDPSFEMMAVKIFQKLNPQAIGGCANPGELQRLLDSLSLGCLETLIRAIAANPNNWDEIQWNFADFFELLKMEMSSYAVENGEGPLNFREFFTLAR